MRILQKIAYIKICWGRAMSWLIIPLSLFNYTTMLILLLKSYNVSSTWPALVFVPATFVSFMIIGHYDIKINSYAIEQSLVNQFNPEIMKLVSEHEKTINSRRTKKA